MRLEGFGGGPPPPPATICLTFHFFVARCPPIPLFDEILSKFSQFVPEAEVEIDFMGRVFYHFSILSLAKSSITLIKIGPQGSKFSEWRELKTFGSKKIEISCWDSELRSNKLMG